MSIAVTGPTRPTPAPTRRGRVPSLRARTVVPDAGAIARRRLVVGVLKRALPLAALAALALTLAWPQITGSEDRMRMAYRKPTEALPDSARVLDARYTGRDERDRPFTLTAERAEQAEGSSIVALVAPRGDVTLENGAWVALMALAGRFDRTTRRLDLAGDVVLHHDAGYEVRTERARIDLAAGRAEGDAPVAVQGPAGSLDAPGFRLEEKGALVIFPGPARMLLRMAEGGP
ncbi:MAG: LPS export ABC transporter periplasmic protein LptC [Elioraea sp.]|nr:LPS export ABC transporter periplasmic protein LptC [Elioraea sp.]